RSRRSNAMSRTIRPTTPRWEVPLVLRGSHPPHRIQGERLHGTLVFKEDGWSVLKDVVPPATDPLDGQLGRPGLWKLVGGIGGGPVQRVFELPPLALTDDDELAEVGGDATSLRQACLDWALQTAQGEPPDHWRPPSREEVEAWLAPGALTIRAGAHVRQAA